MTITRTVYNTEELLGVIVELDPIRSFWRRWFPGSIQSDRERIEWAKIYGNRRLAPLVLPTVPGVPVYTAQEDLYSVRPAYLKPKDTVDAAAMVVRRAGLGELGQLQPLTPQQRYDATIAAILQAHRDTIERREEWMAAQALLNGSITLESPEYPNVTVNFRRNANQTVVLAGASLWSNAAAPIVDQFETWVNMMAKARFGGAPTDVLFTPTAWGAFRKNNATLKLLDVNVRGTNANFDIGVGDGEPIQFKGRFNGTLNLWLYSDYYEDEAGMQVNYMTEGDILLLAPAQRIDGVRAYGAILDKAAQLRPQAIFPKMWDMEDPSGTIIMTQSAPLPIPVNPNGTTRVRVL